MPPAAAPLHDDAAYQALRTHDARFDGRLFVGVTSTGIYCRPVCRVKAPRRENCRFFANAAQAEGQGFRPCLRCRPELAPGLSFTDSSGVLADQAARWLAQAAHAGQDPHLDDIAARLGVTGRHLRRIFVRRHGVSPVAWLATQRLLLAKQLLTDTAMPVTQVALATGFGSLRRFHAAFAQHYRLSPGALRRAGVAPSGVLRLAWRPPLDVAGLLGFVARRALPGQEVVQGLTLRRTLSLPAPGAPLHGGDRLDGWLSARFVPERCELHLDAAPALRPALGGLLQRARQAFDLDADPSVIDPAMAAVPGPTVPGLRLPGSWCGFETAVRVVLGQQVTVAAARTLGQRLLARFGTPLATPHADLHQLFPTPQALAGADPAELGRLGIVRQRVRALQSLAAAVADGGLQLTPGADLDTTLAALTALPGIGAWSAQLIALRCLAWPDAWPASDIGLLKALGQTGPGRDPAAASVQAEAWRPWRGYAVFKLWQSLEADPPTAPSTPSPLPPPHATMTASSALHTALQAQARLATPLGPMTAAATARGLAGLWFDDQAHHPGPLAAPVAPGHPHLHQAARALAAYFDGAEAPLEGLALDLHGTAFQQAVWRVLRALPRGRTATYAEVAGAAGAPAAVRAAGAAIGRNPVSVLVPCHRVLGRGGALTGYAGGLPRKQALLRAEGIALR